MDSKYKQGIKLTQSIYSIPRRKIESPINSDSRADKIFPIFPNAEASSISNESFNRYNIKYMYNDHGTFNNIYRKRERIVLSGHVVSYPEDKYLKDGKGL